MTITSDIQTAIMAADARALATTGPCGINVVPVSVVQVDAQYIYLYNFFMGKTIKNVQVEPLVALTVWKGLSGVQVKATTDYITSGELFNQAVDEMVVRFPDRTLSGVLRLTPVGIFDVSAGTSTGKQLM